MIGRFAPCGLPVGGRKSVRTQIAISSAAIVRWRSFTGDIAQPTTNFEYRSSTQSVALSWAGDRMPAVTRFYYLLFCFWFRADLLTRKRENRFWKAVGAVTLIELWVIVGLYIWAEILLRLPVPPLVVFLVFVFILFRVNYAVLRRGGWEDVEKKLDTYSPAKRRACMAVAAVTSLLAFLFLFVAASELRSGRYPG